MTLTRLRVVVLGTVVLALGLWSAPASAEDAMVEGKGVKVGEGTVLRPILGIETGYISNLYFQDVNEIQVAALRLRAEISTGSAGKARTKVEGAEGVEEKQSDPPDLEWAAGLRVRYTEFPFMAYPAPLQRNVGFDGEVKLIVKPEGTFRVEFFDKVARDIQATNFEPSPLANALQINRIVNELKAGLVFQPGGRAIQAGLHYQNRVDVFEADAHSFANRVQHDFILSAGWQWLPITKFSFEGRFGIYGPLGASTWKQQSNPMSARIGIASAITEKTFGRASFGWAYAGYTNSMGDGAGYNSPVGDVELGYRYSPTGKVTVAYSYDFHDSINANFFRDHAVLFRIDQQIDRFVADGLLDVRVRGYRGVPAALLMSADSREDFMMGVRARLRYLYRDWLSFDGQWLTQVDQTDFVTNVGGITDNPSYIRHELMVGATAAF